MSSEYHFKQGAVWEDYGFSILTDYLHTYNENDLSACVHAHSFCDEEHTAYGGKKYTTRSWIVPRVAKAWNEAGYCTTGICVDCILEALIKLGDENKVKYTGAR
jgi:hypothetical protein